MDEFNCRTRRNRRALDSFLFSLSATRVCQNQKKRQNFSWNYFVPFVSSFICFLGDCVCVRLWFVLFQLFFFSPCGLHWLATDDDGRKKEKHSSKIDAACASVSEKIIFVLSSLATLALKQLSNKRETKLRTTPRKEKNSPLSQWYSFLFEFLANILFGPFHFIIERLISVLRPPFDECCASPSRVGDERANWIRVVSRFIVFSWLGGRVSKVWKCCNLCHVAGHWHTDDIRLDNDLEAGKFKCTGLILWLGTALGPSFNTCSFPSTPVASHYCMKQGRNGNCTFHASH